MDTVVVLQSESVRYDTAPRQSAILPRRYLYNAISFVFPPVFDEYLRETFILEPKILQQK